MKKLSLLTKRRLVMLTFVWERNSHLPQSLKWSLTFPCRDSKKYVSGTAQQIHSR